MCVCVGLMTYFGKLILITTNDMILKFVCWLVCYRPSAGCKSLLKLPGDVDSVY